MELNTNEHPVHKHASVLINRFFEESCRENLEGIKEILEYIPYMDESFSRVTLS
tara:strand:+ start:430 stop:591 length:162 start_codon:yes stop_codon:yes gene_type:complete